MAALSSLTAAHMGKIYLVVKSFTFIKDPPSINVNGEGGRGTRYMYVMW